MINRKFKIYLCFLVDIKLFLKKIFDFVYVYSFRFLLKGFLVVLILCFVRFFDFLRKIS